jgi:hypothetical protein
VTAALIAGGAFGGTLGFLGVPWVLALLTAILVSGALLALRLRRRAVDCPVPKPRVEQRHSP